MVQSSKKIRSFTQEISMKNIQTVFRDINKNSLDDYSLITKWYIDSEIAHFINMVRSKDEVLEPIDPTKYREHLEKKNTIIKMIDINNVTVGWINLDINPKFLLKQDMHSAWVGITIGDAAYRGKGLGRMSALELEKIALSHGLKRIELGVFGFNIAAKNLYEKLGYKHIGPSGHKTFWNGQFWDDLRMEKDLIIPSTLPGSER